MNLAVIYKKIRYYLNKLRYFYYYNQGRTVLPYPPIVFSVEPTNYCNLKCIMCPQSVGGYEKGYMDMNLYRRVIKEIGKLGFEVNLNVGGESLLHPQLFEMIKEAKQCGLKVVFDTNATLLDEEKSRELLQSGLDRISFSFDAEDKETYEKMRRGAKYDQVLANIIAFLKLKKSLGLANPLVNIQVIKMYDQNKILDVSEAFKAQFEGLPVDEFTSVWAHNWVADFSKEKPVDYRDAPRTGIYEPCRMLWKQMSISWDGLVFACCLDLQRRYLVGDVKQSSLMDIWNGERMVGLRRKLIEKRYQEISICKNCFALWSPLEKASPADRIKIMLAKIISGR